MGIQRLSTLTTSQEFSVQNSYLSTKFVSKLVFQHLLKNKAHHLILHLAPLKNKVL